MLFFLRLATISVHLSNKFFYMKKYLLIALIAFGINAKAQITLEHTYNNVGYFVLSTIIPSEPAFGTHPFYLVHLEIDGDKYVSIDRTTQIINFYDLNHVLWKS